MTEPELPTSVCGVCLGAGEVFSVRSVQMDNTYKTIQGFVPCPQCGEPSGPVRQRPSTDRPRRQPGPAR